MIRSSDARDLAGKPGGVFVLKCAPERGRPAPAPGGRPGRPDRRPRPARRQLDRIERLSSLPAAAGALGEPSPGSTPSRVPRPASLAFDNGLGGFTPEGRQYCLTVRGRVTRDARRNGKPRFRAGLHPALPPAPWSNVIANRRFGFLVTEGGSGYTWSGNSQLNRLTPWSNDPVSDPPARSFISAMRRRASSGPRTLAGAVGRHHDRPPRPGVYRLRTPGARDLARDAPVRPARRSGQAHPPEGEEPGRPAAPAVGDVLRRMGAGRRARQPRRCRS